MVRSSRTDIIEEWSSFLRQVSLFAELETDTLKEVAKKLQPISLPRDAVVYQEGEPGDALYFIQSGRVKITTIDANQKEKVLNYLGRGETFGEMALLSGTKRSVTAKVDSTADFLVLYKKDFESFLKKNPSASFYLSRLISQRLLSTAKTPIVRTMNPEILGFLCHLDKETRLIFMTNLALALTEQTRRKILLLELDSGGIDLVKSIGLKPILSSSSMLHSEDLRNPKILDRLALIHPSGLEIITLPKEIFSSTLFRSIPPFLASLREVYDYVLVDVSVAGDSQSRSGSQLDDITRSILSECDSIFYTSSYPPGNLKFLESQVPESISIKTVTVGENTMISSPSAFYVPWNQQIISHFKRGGHPYLYGFVSEPTQRALNRIARAIGKLQVGLAMGSGAAYGYTLIGMLKVFERERIPIDFISGTSMGALLGSFFASGKSALEIESIAHSITKVWLRKNILRDLNIPWLHGGILQGQAISRFLKNILGEVEFKNLQIPFTCAATDIMTGDGIVLREGIVWEAVRASLSLPMVLCPYKIGNLSLVDGGLVNPVPTSIIASMGADILISVNLTNKTSERKVSLRRLGIFPYKSPGLFDIFFKMLYTMQYQIASVRKDLSHIVIRPETRNFSWVDLHRSKQIIPLGEEAAEESLTKIKARLPFFADFCRVPLRKPRPIHL